MWLRKLLAGLFGQTIEPTLIHCDNQSCVHLLVNLIFHDKSTHIDIEYHYIRDMVQRGMVDLQYVLTDDKSADIITKIFPRIKFAYFCEQLGVI